MKFEVLLNSENYNGQVAEITFNPDTGGTFNLGSHILPYTYDTTYPYGTYSLYFSGFGITCNSVLVNKIQLAWRRLDFSCEVESNFLITNSIVGLSTPGGMYYDSPTDRLYVMDYDDNTRGNIYYFTPSTASTNASFVTFITGNTRTRVVQPAGTQTTVTEPWLKTPMLYNVAVDPIYKRLYGSGSGTVIVPGNSLPTDNLIRGLFIYDITGNTLTELVYGNNAPYERSLIYFNNNFIFVDDTTTSSLIRLSRQNPTLPGTSIPLAAGVTADLYNNGPIIAEVGTGSTPTMLWVVNFAGPVGGIGVFDQNLVLQTQVSLPGSSNSTPGTAPNFWNTIYYDKDYDYVYATNIGSGRLWIIKPNSNNIGGTIVRTYEMRNRRESKTHNFNRMSFDSVSNKLYIAHQCTSNVNTDSSGPFKTYEINRQTLDIVRLINNFDLFNLFPVTNEYGSDSFATISGGTVGWSTAPWNKTDGAIVFYNNNVTSPNNTGIVNVTTLEKYNINDNSPTGEIKNNVIGDPDYIPPYFSLDPTSGCPLTFTLNCPVMLRTPTSNPVTSFFYEVGIESSVKNNPLITQLIVCALNTSGTIVSQDVYNAPFNTAYFHDEFTGLPSDTYTIGVRYSGSTGILQQCGFPAPTATPTSTSTPTIVPTITPTSTSTPTITATPTSTSTPTATISGCLLIQTQLILQDDGCGNEDRIIRYTGTYYVGGVPTNPPVSITYQINVTQVPSIPETYQLIINTSSTTDTVDIYTREWVGATCGTRTLTQRTIDSETLLTPGITICPTPPPTATPTITSTPTSTSTPTITSTPTSTSTPPSSFVFAGNVSTYSTSGLACAAGSTCARSFYRDIPVFSPGMIMYDDVGLTTPFNGGGNWIVIVNSTTFCSGTSRLAIQVDSGGVILSTFSCP